MFRYRLSTMLVAVAVIAVGVFLWLRYVSPNVARLSISGGNLVVHLTDEYAQRTYSNDSELQALTGVTGGGGVTLFHDAYISFPLYVPIAAGTVFFFLIGSAYCILRSRIVAR
ncbi:MAG: hypothetical protein QGH33_10185 [Pirellulaceae bacterium]|nr:hypothetical protein [Pirellulaceae bacterium]HJN09325.1 hypothetical protein [Pirellulaceae bacterium]